jgi:2-polyprenyl-3-methyl-5-hydroxy-6-metoxy-1,4-benzoquinol methylase
MPVDMAKMQEFLGRALGDIGAAVHAPMVVIGDRLGLYKALAKSGPMTAAELAKATGTHERYVREWLNNQAAGGYVAYDAASARYRMPPEQAEAMADETSPFFLPGAWQAMTAAARAIPRLLDAFRDGKGMDWGEHDPDLFVGTERFFRPAYVGNLTSSWIPALEGVKEKLEKGAKVADVGCGHGASTIVMAKAYPRSTFHGFDSHEASVRAARERAKQAGVSDRVSFDVANASSFPGTYDLVCHFDCLHDMSDPVGAAKGAKKALGKDGTWMIVEPVASDRPEENFNPVGRTYYGASTMVCVPCSLHGGGPALGAQAGEARLRDVVVRGGGFTRFRRAAETPFNMVLEARP